jgi:hypothetical protein
MPHTSHRKEKCQERGANVQKLIHQIGNIKYIYIITTSRYYSSLKNNKQKIGIQFFFFII